MSNKICLIFFRESIPFGLSSRGKVSVSVIASKVLKYEITLDMSVFVLMKSDDRILRLAITYVYPKILAYLDTGK